MVLKNSSVGSYYQSAQHHNSEDVTLLKHFSESRKSPTVMDIIIFHPEVLSKAMLG